MSPLHNALSEYLAARRALGTQLAWPESSLRNFVQFVEAEGAAFVTTELALRWALRSVGVQRATHARRLGIVRAFAAWLQAADARTQVPAPRLLPAKQRRPAPHIYSEKQITELMGAARTLRSKSGLRGATFNVLIGLLAATGLRPGEALALDVDDVDLVNGRIGHFRQVFSVGTPGGNSGANTELVDHTTTPRPAKHASHQPNRPADRLQAGGSRQTPLFAGSQTS